MNQTQRQFLLDSIERQYKNERQALNQEKPEEPSLNNYLVASILDGSFKMKDPESVRAAIRDRVVKLGKREALIFDSGDAWGNRNRQDKDIDAFIKLPIDILFELPDRYAIEKEKYDKALEKWKERMRVLESAFEAMKIKTQLGSDKALSALIDQADQLCSMSLIASSKLFFTAPETDQKKLK